MSRRRLGLPPDIVSVIDAWIEGSGVGGDAKLDVRQDVEQHFLDGLAAGRSVEELIAAFGDPDVTAPLLAASLKSRPDRRDVPGGWRAFWDTTRADLRQATRVVRGSPAYALTVVAVLGLGIGANAVTFTVLNEALLRPLPVEDQDALVNIIAEVPGGNSFTGFSVADFETLRDQNDVLVDLAAMSAIRLRMGEEPATERVVATLASPNYFDLLGVPAAAGTTRLPPFTSWGADAVAVVSHAFWQARLGGDPAVVGSTIRLDGRSIDVIGVAREGFAGTFTGFPSDMWLPLSAADAFMAGFDPDDRSIQFLELLGRRRVGVSVIEVDAGLDAVAADIERVYPDLNRGHRVRVVAMTGLDDSLRLGVLTFVGVLVAVAALVLLVACLNVGSILLVRAMARERELAIRIAVGAGGGRLLRQLLTETAVLAGGGALLAVLLAGRTTRLLRDFVSTVSGGLGLELTLDWRVLSLTAGAAVLAALLASLIPGLHVLRKDPAGVLRHGGMVGGGVGRARNVLVVGQVALSVLLVVSAALFARALAQGLRADPGFDADGVAGVAVTFDRERFDEGTTTALQDDLIEQVRGLPGITAAAWSTSGPIGVARSPTSVSVPGVEPPSGETGFIVDAKTVGSSYFETVGVGFLVGESFGASADDSEVRLAVVSEEFAIRLLGGSSPLGRVIEVEGEPIRVVGVAQDVRYILQDETPDPLVYLSLGGAYFERLQLLIRSATAPAAYRASIQGLLVAADPSQPPVALRSAREALSDALLPQRVGAVVVGTMGVIALLLASLGLYGLIQYSVTRDTRALGIRMALGGRRADVIAAVLRGGLVLVSIGLALGGGVALLVTPGLRPFLVGVEPRDPATYLLVAVSFALVAVAASILPALRASRIDPARTLRSD